MAEEKGLCVKGERETLFPNVNRYPRKYKKNRVTHTAWKKISFDNDGRRKRKKARQMSQKICVGHWF